MKDNDEKKGVQKNIPVPSPMACEFILEAWLFQGLRTIMAQRASHEYCRLKANITLKQADEL